MSLPNVILLLVAGYIADKIGRSYFFNFSLYFTSVALISYSSISCVGQLIFAISLYTKNFPCALFGRLVYGYFLAFPNIEKHWC